MNRLRKTLLFIFSGKAGVGKTYCSNVLLGEARKLGYLCEKTSFASGIKNVASEMGWDGLKDTRGRKLLISIGAAGRKYDRDTWVRKAMEDLEGSPMYPLDIVCIDDWRFPNELYFIESNFPLYVPIPIRVSAPKREILVGTKEYNDRSETSLDTFTGFKYVVDNNPFSDGPVEKVIYEILSKEISNY